MRRPGRRHRRAGARRALAGSVRRKRPAPAADRRDRRRRRAALGARLGASGSCPTAAAPRSCTGSGRTAGARGADRLGRRDHGRRPAGRGPGAAVVAADEPTAAARRATAERDDPIVWPSGRRPTGCGCSTWPRGSGAWSPGSATGTSSAEQRPDGGPLAVISWAGPEIDPGEVTNELHMVDPETRAVRDLGRPGPRRARWPGGGPATPGTWPTWPCPAATAAPPSWTWPAGDRPGGDLGRPGTGAATATSPTA